MLNICNFIGRMGSDPELRRTQDGRPVVNFNLAVSESWRDKNTGEKREKTEWVRFVVWNENVANILTQYTRKGSKIYASGRMQTRKYQDQDGQDRYATEIVMSGIEGKVILLDPKRDDMSDTVKRVQDGVNNMPLPVGGEDTNIPF